MKKTTRNRTIYKLLALPIFLAATCKAFATPTDYTVKTDGLTVTLSPNGGILTAEIAGKPCKLTGGTVLAGLTQQGAAVAQSANGACSFTRTLTDDKGHTAVVIDRFSPTKDSIRWEVEITSADAPWSTAIETQLNYPATADSRFWTTWGYPNNQFGKWADPMESQPFTTQNYFYQYRRFDSTSNIDVDYSTQAEQIFESNQKKTSPDPVASPKKVKAFEKELCLSIPLFYFAEPTADKAVTLVLSPEDTILDMDFRTSTQGGLEVVRRNHRLGNGHTVRFSMDLAQHPADTRAALGWMVKRYPHYFNPAIPNTQNFSGSVAYSGAESKFDPEPLRRMGFAYNWKCSEDFPYMGLFLPPMTNAEERWSRAPDHQIPGKPSTTSYLQMNDYARWMKSQGFGVLSYFNTTEYGRKMKWPIKPSAWLDKPDYWKSAADFLIRHNLTSAVLMNGSRPVFSNCYGALVMDPGDPGYLAHLVSQAKRNCTSLPDTDGIAIDRNDWINSYNLNADDGVSLVNGKPARSLFISWQRLMKELTEEMHSANKVVFGNNCSPRIEVVRWLDGVYAEWAADQWKQYSYINYTALTCVRKPAAIWTVSDRELTDEYMQRMLYLGIFPTAPYPHNNHCLNPSPLANAQFLAYGSLMNAIRGRKWVLEPHCVETTTPNVKVNLFEVPGGYALPVVFGEKADSATVTVRNIPNIDKLQATVLHPGADSAIAIAITLKDGTPTLAVPLKRGCAMVQLTTQL